MSEDLTNGPAPEATEAAKTEQETTTAIASPMVAIGKSIIKEARDKYDESRRKAVIGEVERLMNQEVGIRKQRDLLTRGYDLLQAKLKAIENGEFSFTGGGRIKMNDKTLRKYDPQDHGTWGKGADDDDDSEDD